MTEKKLYVIPQAIVDDLSRMVPYAGGEEFTDPREYLLNYFRLYTPQTYYQDGTIQCTRGRNRSFLDLYFLTKAQFPEFTLQEMAKLFLSFQNEFYNYQFYLFVYFCDYIHKPVIYSNRISSNHNFIGDKSWLDKIEQWEIIDISLRQIFDLAELDYYHFVKKD